VYDTTRYQGQSGWFQVGYRPGTAITVSSGDSGYGRSSYEPKPSWQRRGAWSFSARRAVAFL